MITLKYANVNKCKVDLKIKDGYLKIVSDGTVSGTEIKLNGKPIIVKRLVWDLDAGNSNVGKLYLEMYTGIK